MGVLVRSAPCTNKQGVHDCRTDAEKRTTGAAAQSATLAKQRSVRSSAFTSMRKVDRKSSMFAPQRVLNRTLPRRFP